MKFAIVQFNPFIGDVEGNCKRIIHFYHTALEKGAECVVFPEMALLGYPPMDILFHSSVKIAVHSALDKLKSLVTYPMILGSPFYLDDFVNDGSFVADGSLWAEGSKILFGQENNFVRGLYNCLLVLSNGKLVKVVAKSLLPNYDVFDEKRYFIPGPKKQDRNFEINGIKIGLSVCEDIWFDQHDNHFDYDFDPRTSMHGCDLILNISASPYHRDKQFIRKKLLLESAKMLNAPIVYVNQVGGMEEILFDGFSAVCSPTGFWEVPPSCFEEKILEWEYKKFNKKTNTSIKKKQEEIKLSQSLDEFNPDDSHLKELYQILSMGIRDFFIKQGFEKAVIGLSGGIDSALVASLAINALGSDKVFGITMPSDFSSPDSVSDSVKLARHLGMDIKTLPIEENVEKAFNSLGASFSKTSIGTAEENIQARVRGLLLMAFSNKLGCLLLSTSNKSELAVGYSTLYGDMNGALSVIGDLYKTEVRALAKWINRQKKSIPQNILDKPPSAELKPGQKDTDNLPEYEILDKILIDSIERLLSAEEIAKKRDMDLTLVKDIQNKIHRSEHKRFQSPPILRVSPKAFGRGRRYPLVKSDNYLF